MKKLLLLGRYWSSIFEKDIYATLPKFMFKDKIVIGENGYHCYFGYYDTKPLSEGNRILAYLKVPEKYTSTSMADICLYDIVAKKSKKVAETNTWNWQQGCMLNWINNSILSFNSYDIERKSYNCNWLDIETGELRKFQRAAYAYNSKHSRYLSLNFYRLDCYAKGYGYRFKEDSMDLSNDGIWEIDIKTGTSCQLVTIQEVVDFMPHYACNSVHYINHVCYTPKEDAIIFIHRWQQPGGEFVSRLILMDLKTKKMKALLNNRHVSHFYWKNDKQLLIYATNNDNVKGYMILDVESGKTKLVEGFPKEDGHPSYNSDCSLVVTDTYPNNARMQHLFIFDVARKKLQLLDTLHSPLKFYNEYRCDLHPRWSHDGNYVVIDNTNENRRTLNIYNVNCKHPK